MAERIKKIAIISCYFGELPLYFNLYLKSIMFNKQIDWYLFLDDIKNIKGGYENVFIKRFSLNDFNHLATRKLGIDTCIEDPYKICDFKPAYGLIFEDILTKYLYWGFSDIDIIYGNILKFFPINNYKQKDIISFYQNFLSGPFAIFKNTERVNKLFFRIYNVEKILTEPEYNGLDENISRKICRRKRIRYFPGYIKEYGLKNLRDLRYNFQWYLKKKEAYKSNMILDMTEALWYFEKSNEINPLFLDLLRSDRAYERSGRMKWEILWENGKLFYRKNNKEIMAFHFIDSKRKGINCLSAACSKRFCIKHNGIHFC